MRQKLNYKYKIILKRKGRFKEAVYSIIIVNNKNKFIEKLGIYEIRKIHNKKVIILNKFLLIYWLQKGAYPTKFLSKFISIIFSKFF